MTKNKKDKPVDIYMEVAKRVFGKRAANQHRQLVKTCCFSLIYWGVIRGQGSEVLIEEMTKHVRILCCMFHSLDKVTKGD